MKQIKINVKKKEDLKDVMEKFERVEKEFIDLPDGLYEIVIKKPSRTSRQNRAIHMFFSNMADALNEKHMYMNKDFFKDKYEVEWNPTMVKELIWRPLQKAMFDVDSSLKLKTDELTKVADSLQKNFAKKGIILNFPNIEDKQNGVVPYEVIE